MSLAGFTTLPISYSSSIKHYLFARAHNVSKKKSNKQQTQQQNSSTDKKSTTEFPEGRTLFLVNVPPDATDRDLISFFKYAGTIQRVVFDQDHAIEDTILDEDESSEEEEEDEDEQMEDTTQPKKKRKGKKEEKPPAITPLQIPSLRSIRKTGQTAHIIFLDGSSLTRALASPKPRPWPEPTAPVGLAHYAAMYDALRPPLDSVIEFANSYMALYDWKAAKAMEKFKSEYKKGEAIVDEDGFTLVVRGGAYGKTMGGGVSVADKKWESDQANGTKSRKKKEPKEKPEFYAFQKAEKQRSDLLKLRAKWEEDKAKVEKLKQSRRFRPY